MRASVARCGGGGSAYPGGVPSTIVRGAWRQALSLPRPPVLWSGQPGFRVPCVLGAVGAGVGTQHRPHSVRPCGLALLAVGVAEGRPRGGGAFHRCEGLGVRCCPSPGRPSSGAGSQGSASRVPRVWSLQHGDPAPAPRRAPLRAGVARCGGGGRASPGGVLSTVVRGAWCQALSLPRPPVLWSGQPGFRDPCVPGAVDAGVGTQHRLHGVRPCGLTLLAVGVADRAPRGGVLSTVVRGAWCQALSLPRAPVLWSGQPGFRVPCVLGAVGAGVGSQHQPHSVRPCGLVLLAVGVAEGRPRGGVLSTVVRGSVSGAVPPPAARPLERAARVPRPVCPGCGRCGHGDPAPAPQRAPLRAGFARCGGGGRASPGGVLSTVVRGAWCQALSLPRPPVLWGGQPGFRDPCVPGAVDAGVGTQHRLHGVRPCGLTLLAVGVAEGRPRGGGGAFHRCEGRLVSGAVPPPSARPLEQAVRVPRPVCPGCGQCGRGVPSLAPQRAPLRAGVARFGGG